MQETSLSIPGAATSSPARTRHSPGRRPDGPARSARHVHRTGPAAGQRVATRLVAADHALEAGSPLVRLRALGSAVLEEEHRHRGLEVAVRAWAAQDDDARAAVERVDALRSAHLGELTAGVLPDPGAAVDRARTAYYLLLGSRQVVPAGSLAELGPLWQGLLAALAAWAGRSPSSSGAREAHHRLCR